MRTRNRGTLGGSLCHVDPAAALPGVMLALDAVLEVASVGGTRRVPIAQWPTMYMTPDLEADELLTGVRISRHAARTNLRATHGFCEPAIAVIGVDESARRLDAAEQLLLGHALDKDTIEQASALAIDLPGMDDVHANSLYRRRIARVMVSRALHLARQRVVDEVMA